MPTVTEFLKGLPEEKKAIAKTLHDLIRKAAPSLKPFIHESKMMTALGYGWCTYKTKSGCEGEWFSIGIAERKDSIALHICAVEDGQYIVEKYSKELGKCKTGKSCIQIKKLENIDLKTVEKLVKKAEKLGPMGQ